LGYGLRTKESGRIIYKTNTKSLMARSRAAKKVSKNNKKDKNPESALD
jgi:hypothetical protein